MNMTISRLMKILALALTCVAFRASADCAAKPLVVADIPVEGCPTIKCDYARGDEGTLWVTLCSYAEICTVAECQSKCCATTDFVCAVISWNDMGEDKGYCRGYTKCDGWGNEGNTFVTLKKTCAAANEKCSEAITASSDFCTSQKNMVNADDLTMPCSGVKCDITTDVAKCCKANANEKCSEAITASSDFCTSQKNMDNADDLTMPCSGVKCDITIDVAKCCKARESNKPSCSSATCPEGQVGDASKGTCAGSTCGGENSADAAKCCASANEKCSEKIAATPDYCPELNANDPAAHPHNTPDLNMPCTGDVCKNVKRDYLICCRENNAGCFARESTVACRLLDGGASAAAAYSACWGAAPRARSDGKPDASDTAAAASLTLMSELVAGDLVVTEKGGVPHVDRVVVNQHRAASPAFSETLLTLVHAAGSLSITPDHVVWLDGGFNSAGAAAVGSVLSNGLTVTAITMHVGGIVNPLVAGGTILASDKAGGGPVLAATANDGFADVLLSAYPKYSASFALAAVFPTATQAFYDAAIEPHFNAAEPFLRAFKAAAPAPLVGLAFVAYDAALATGLGIYTLGLCLGIDTLGLKGVTTIAAAAVLAAVTACRAARK